MKGKHSTHLVNVPEASTSSTSDPDYYNEHGDPVYAHMVNIQDNKCKPLIQFPDGKGGCTDSCSMLPM